MFNLFGRTHATKMTGAIGRCGNDSFALKLDNDKRATKAKVMSLPAESGRAKEQANWEYYRQR